VTAETATAAISAISPILDQKIDMITAGLLASYGKNLRLLSNQENISTIIEYIQALKTETSLSDHYRKDNIELLTRFSKFHNNKLFKDITRDEFIAFLDSFRKLEDVDPLHKWIGTYNQFRMYLGRFFKWLYNPNIEHIKRPTPAVIENVPRQKRKEISIYQASDMWTQEDDLLFLKFCPSRREQCYHAISRDLSCRPHEILKLKIKDVKFKTTGKSQYAEVVVNGKTGARQLPLINSIPYLKDYLDHDHPMPSNPNAPLICGIGRGLGRHISPLRFAHIYENFKKKVFPSLLELPSVLPEDKKLIAELLKKPWNPYVRRHSALTEKAKFLKEPLLKMHAGWSPRSQMHLKYEHWFGNESSESLLEAYGLLDKGVYIDQLKSKQCPNCANPNKPDSRFCTTCRMVLSYDSYEEVLRDQEKHKQNDEKMERLEQKIAEFDRVLGLS
jgi:integrase/recombinase XerD